MCFRFTKTSGRGIPPGPRTTFPRATRRLPGMARPRKPEAERGSRTNRRERGTRPADRPPRPAPALRPPVLPVSGAGGARPSDRDVWMGSVPPSFRPGSGGDSTPAGGMDGVRAGGRGDRRRSGGNADRLARRSLRGLSREADGHRPAERSAAVGRTSGGGPTGGTLGPQPRTLPERGFTLGVRGGAAPRQPPQGTHGVWPQGVSWLSHLRVAQASPAEPPNTPLGAAPGTAENGPSRAGSSASRSPASQTARATGDLSLRATQALSTRSCGP